MRALDGTYWRVRWQRMRSELVLTRWIVATPEDARRIDRRGGK